MERFGKGGVSEKSAVFWTSHVTHQSFLTEETEKKTKENE
jgi:hypothetical protein